MKGREEPAIVSEEAPRVVSFFVAKFYQVVGTFTRE